MRKSISLLLAGVMVLGTIGTAFATTDAGNGTKVSYTGTGSEAYTITVPAKLTPSSDGDVEAQGTWASNRKLVVTAPDTVSLLNDISGADEKVLDVTFAGIAREGDNNRAITVTENIAVGAIQNALFGTWSGKIVYTVGMEDVAGSSAVTMLDGDGQTVNTFAMSAPSFRSSAPMSELQNVQVNGETVDPENYYVSEGSTIITFKPDYVASLGNGNHTVDINSQSGTASGSFTVIKEIPDGGVYTAVGGTKYTAGDEFPSAPQEGDIYKYGNYEYCYGADWCNSCNEWGNTCGCCYYADGWGVHLMNDVAEPGDILGHINGESLTTSLSSAFYGCTNLTVAPAIPVGVEDISSAFSFCTSLTTAPVIPSTVKNMDSAFRGCTSLTTAPELPNGITNLGWAFADCPNLTTAPVIPSTVKYMDRTFLNCTSLTTAPEIPSGVIILVDTFNGCKALTGTVIINANQITKDTTGGVMDYSCGKCFYGVDMSNITLTGEASTEVLNLIGGTGNNYTPIS